MINSKHIYVLKPVFLCILLGALVLSSCGNRDQRAFTKLNADAEWELHMTGTCADNWMAKWFLDGLHARVKHSEKGMAFCVPSDSSKSANDAVLWTRKIYKGDIKIEYNYTKTDSQIINENVIYIQASGTGEGLFDEDIFQWNKYREKPCFSKYFNNMNLLHIGYASFPEANNDPDNDEIRAYRYPGKEGEMEKAELSPVYTNTGLFKPGKTYHITIIKSKSKLFFNVKGEDVEKTCVWNLTNGQTTLEGRIGLRHSCNRCAIYRDFNIYTKSRDN